jgi:hypothetical protein
MRLLAHHPEVVVHRQYPHELGVAKYWAHLLRIATEPADYLDSAHPETFTADVATVGHNPFFGDFLAADDALNGWLGSRNVERFGGFVQATIDEFYAQVATAEGKTEARYVAEKCLPDHLPDLFRDLYKDAREIVLVRDIRDVVCSVLAFNAKRGQASFGREWLNDDASFVDQLHADLDRLVLSWRRRSETALLVRYEDLIQSPTQELANVLRYLDVDSSPERVEAVLTAAAETTPELDAHRTTASPLASIGRWRTDLAEARPDLSARCHSLFADLLAELGYAVPPMMSRANEVDAILADATERLHRLWAG